MNVEVCRCSRFQVEEDICARGLCTSRAMHFHQGPGNAGMRRMPQAKWSFGHNAQSAASAGCHQVLLSLVELLVPFPLMHNLELGSAGVADQTCAGQRFTSCIHNPRFPERGRVRKSGGAGKIPSPCPGCQVTPAQRRILDWIHNIM